MSDEIRKYDDDGKLIVSGYEWMSRDSAWGGLIIFPICLCGYGIFGLIASLMGRAIIYEIWTPLLFIAVGGITAVIIRPLTLLRNGYHFNADGTIDAPYGMPWPDWKLRRLRTKWREILSIEKLPSPKSRNSYSVVMYKSNGDIVHLTNKEYGYEYAHKIARELTMALEELRVPRSDPRY